MSVKLFDGAFQYFIRDVTRSGRVSSRHQAYLILIGLVKDQSFLCTALSAQHVRLWEKIISSSVPAAFGAVCRLPDQISSTEWMIAVRVAKVL